MEVFRIDRGKTHAAGSCTRELTNIIRLIPTNIFHFVRNLIISIMNGEIRGVQRGDSQAFWVGGAGEREGEGPRAGAGGLLACIGGAIALKTRPSCEKRDPRIDTIRHQEVLQRKERKF